MDKIDHGLLMLNYHKKLSVRTRDDTRLKAAEVWPGFCLCESKRG